MKPKTIKNKLTKLCSELIHTRDEGRCQWCGNTGERLHTSHIFPKGQYPHMAYTLENMKLLCFACHFHKWHRNPILAHEWVKQWLGAKKYKKLYAMAHDTKLRQRFDIKKEYERLQLIG